LGVNADKYAIFSFSNFYDEKTFKRLWNIHSTVTHINLKRLFHLLKD
jgi:hypothetical protein